MARDSVNRLPPRPSGVSVTTLQEKETHRLSAVGAVAGNESDHSLLTTGSSVEGILSNSTPNSLISTRTVHMQPRITVNNHPPQYGNFYTGYDPMTGARTAAVLGSLLLLLVFYIIYKAKCHHDWTEEDDFYLQQYKQRQAKKALGEQPQQQQPRRGTHYVIDPVCSPDPTILAATAKWIQMQPLEDAVPATGPGEKRKNRLALTKYLSFSAEHINRQLLRGPPLIPNGHGPPPSGEDSDRERSCNEYVPNGFLKYIHKEGLNGPDWLYNDTQDSDSERGPVEFYIEEEERHHHRRRASSHDEHIYMGEREVDELFSTEQQNPRKKSGKHQLEHFSSLDRHNNNDELEDRTLQLNPDVDVCTNCLSDRNSSVGIIHDPPSRTSLYLPPDREILLTPTPRRSRLRSRQQQRSQDRASLESHQRSIEDDSPDFCVSILPARDTAGLSLDMTSSTETTAEHQIPSTIATVPMLSYIDNLANNSTFSTMSTATASSNGSYQSEGQDIPMTDQALPMVQGTILTPQPKRTVVEVSIETALASSSKPIDQDDTKL